MNGEIRRSHHRPLKRSLERGGGVARRPRLDPRPLVPLPLRLALRRDFLCLVDVLHNQFRELLHLQHALAYLGEVVVVGLQFLRGQGRRGLLLRHGADLAPSADLVGAFLSREELVEGRRGGSGRRCDDGRGQGTCVFWFVLL